MTETSSSKPENTAAPAAWKQFLAGGAGGVAIVLSGHPLDTIKVRLQTNPNYGGMMDCFKATISREGFRGLYRGMLSPLLGVSPIFALSFAAYGAGLKMLAGDDKGSLLLHTIAGGISGVATTAIMAPGERIKCLLQIQGQEKSAAPKYNGPMDVVKKVYAESGIRGIYRGTAATLLRDVPGSAAYFGLYEGAKRALTPEDGKLSVSATLAAGGLAGVANWVVALPGDVLKSKIQSSPEGTYKSIGDCLKKTVKAEGVGALYRGWAPVMTRAFPANALCFTAYELTMKLLDYLVPPN